MVKIKKSNKRPFRTKRVKKISTKVDYFCPYFKVVKNDFIMPNGARTTYWLLKRKNYVTVLAKDGEYAYLVELYRFSIERKSLEFPAGAIEKGETPLRAARRELKEETGLTAKKFTYLGSYYAFIGMSDLKAHAFLAEGFKFGRQKLDAAEYGLKVKIADIGKMIAGGKINGEHALNTYLLYKLNDEKQ